MPSWLMSSRRPTNGETRLAPAFAASSPWLVLKISVQLVLMPSSAKREIASRPFSLIATLTTMFGASLAKWRPLLEHPVDVVGDHLGRYRPGRDLADLLEDRVVRPADLGVEARVGGDAVENAPSGGGPDLFDLGRVEEDLHRAAPGSPGRAWAAGSSSRSAHVLCLILPPQSTGTQIDRVQGSTPLPPNRCGEVAASTGAPVESPLDLTRVVMCALLLPPHRDERERRKVRSAAEFGRRNCDSAELRDWKTLGGGLEQGAARRCLRNGPHEGPARDRRKVRPRPR